MRVAIAVESRFVRQWIADCVRKLKLQDGVELAGVLIAGESTDAGDGKSRGESKGKSRGESKSKGKSEPFGYRWLERRISRRCPAMRQSDVAEAAPGVPIAKSEGDVEAVKRFIADRKPDVLLNLAPGFLGEASFPELRYGIWRFDYGPEEGFQTGFEMLLAGLLRKRETATLRLIRARHGRQADVVLKQGTFAASQHSFASRMDQIHRFASEWPAYACRDIVRGNAVYLDRAPAEIAADGRTDPSPSMIPKPGRPPSPVHAFGGAVVVQALVLLARDKVKRFLTRWFVAEHWNVGIVDRPIESFLDEPGSESGMPEVDWLPKRPQFMADPFGVQIDGRLHLLVEEYDYASGKGVISSIRRGDEPVFGPERTVLNLPFHMSYPYLLRHEGEIYCIPETYQAKEVALYKAIRFPNEWEKAATLIEGFQAVDATPFRHAGRWWLLCTDEQTGWNSHLYIWHADELLGPWRPHEMNPVKMDVRSARPAGTPFYSRGELFRPAQDCSRTYGGAVVLNRIRTLTTKEFDEEPVKRLAPDPRGPYRDGLHTLSAAGGLTLIDSKRESIYFKVFMIRVVSILKGKLRIDAG